MENDRKCWIDNYITFPSIAALLFLKITFFIIIHFKCAQIKKSYFRTVGRPELVQRKSPFGDIEKDASINDNAEWEQLSENDQKKYMGRAIMSQAHREVLFDQVAEFVAIPLLFSLSLSLAYWIYMRNCTVCMFT